MAKCVQCGYCCTTGPCAYGEWDAINERCMFLSEDNKCDIYDDIKNDKSSPAMGEGCSSSLFNTVRENKIKEMNKV